MWLRRLSATVCNHAKLAGRHCVDSLGSVESVYRALISAQESSHLNSSVVVYC
eukprot:SAG11_NODE_8013_length_1069_cov_2.665979_1_plen_52_part_10